MVARESDIFEIEPDFFNTGEHSPLDAMPGWYVRREASDGETEFLNTSLNWVGVCASEPFPTREAAEAALLEYEEAA